jgi:hypothetical protein
VILLLGIYPILCKQDTVDICAQMLTAALVTIAKLRKQPQCPTTDEWIMKYGIYTQQSIAQPQKIMTWGLKVNGCNWRTSC